MADLTSLIGIGNGSPLQLRHGGEGLFKSGGEGIEIGLPQGHPAHIQPQPQVLVMPDQLTKALPLG